MKDVGYHKTNNRFTNKGIVRCIILYLLLVGLVIVLFTLKPNKRETNHHFYNGKARILKEEPISKDITDVVGKIESLHLQYGTYKRTNYGKIIVVVYVNGNLVQEWVTNAENLKDNQYEPYYFEKPQNIRENDIITVSLRAEDFQEGQFVALWTGSDTTENDNTDLWSMYFSIVDPNYQQLVSLLILLTASVILVCWKYDQIRHAVLRDSSNTPMVRMAHKSTNKTKDDDYSKEETKQKQSKNKAKTRDPGVEFARIFGCLIVIGCHMKFGNEVNGAVDLTRALSGAFVGDGVGVFWLILGFFLFKGEDYSKLMKRTVVRVFVPGILVVLFDFYFSAWLKGNTTSVFSSIMKTPTEYASLAETFLRWKPPASQAHLWFVYVYVFIIFAYPALSGAVHHLEERSRSFIFFTVIVALFFLVNDLKNNTMLYFAHQTIMGAVPGAVIVILGHFLYKQKPLFEHYGWLAAIVFLAVNVARTYIGLSLSVGLSWFSVSGIICASCVVSFAMWISSHIHGECLKNIICRIGSYTFPIYLVHWTWLSLLNRVQFKQVLLDGLSSALPASAAYLTYLFIAEITVFLLCLITVFVIRIFKKGFIHVLFLI
jgi:hypothetical protein